MSDVPPITSETSRSGFAPWDDSSRAIAAGLKRVATGLGILYYTLALTVLTMIGLMILQYVLRKDPMGAMVAYLVVGVTWISMALDLVGGLFCLAAPEETGARSLIYGSVIFKLAGLSLTIARSVFGRLPSALEQASTPVGIVTFLLMILFLRKLAIYLGAPKLAGRSRNILIAGCILVGSSLILMPTVAGRMQNADSSQVGLVVLLGASATVCGFFVFFKYLSLLRDLRTAIPAGSSAK